MQFVLGAIGLCLLTLSVALAEDKTNCVSKELSLKSCLLRLEKSELNFSESAVRVYDGTWREVTDLPAVDETTDWKSVKLRKLGELKLVEMKVWQEEKSAPTLDLEALHWRVFTLEGTNLNLQQDRIIQRRRRKSETEATPASRYLNGSLESHRLILEGGEVFWKVGHSKGKLIAEK